MDVIWENSFVTPINDWIDGFELKHAKNNWMHANESNLESLSVRDPGDSDIKCNFIINICENSTICKAYFSQGAGLNNKA